MRPGLDPANGVSARWIRWLIRRSFPSDFRLRYGEPLLQAFLDLREETSQRRSWGAAPGAILWMTVRTSWHLARAGMAERWVGRVRRARYRNKTRGDSMLATLISEVKQAVRSHRKRPGLAILSTLTLALGIGATTAIFSVVNGVLLRPLPYPDSDELVSIQVNSGIGSSEGFYDLSEPEFLDMGDEVSAFAQVAGYDRSEVTWGDSSSARRVRVALTTANLFPLLRVTPLLGRTFSEEEDRPGAERVVVLSYGMWRTGFGGDPDILGKTMTLADMPVTIIGVMPPEFDFPSRDTDAYSQLQLDRESPWERNNHYLPTLARLAAGRTLSEAQAEVDVLAARSTEDYPEYYPNAGYRVRLRSFQDAIVGNARTPLFILLAAVGFVLLTACVNVANLLLARGENRKREIAVRAALGASRSRVALLLLTESFVLAVVGGILGLSLAAIGVRGLLVMAPSAVPRLDQVSIDGSVLLFSLLLAMATGLIFGVIPAMQPPRQNLQDVLKEGGRGGGASRTGQKLRRALVAVQVMLALVLATGSGLMLRSVSKMYQVDKGFETEDVLTFRIYPRSALYDTPEKVVGLYRELLGRIQALPGVLAAGATYSLPMSGGGNKWSITIEGRPVASVGEAPAALVQRVTPEYFQALGMILVSGRLFTPEDDAESTPVVVVSEAFAAEHWPGEDPLGKRMKVFLPDWPWMEVVGVVRDTRHQGPTEEPEPRWYVPHAQGYLSAYASPLTNTVVVKADANPISLMAPIRSVLAELDSSIPVSEVRTMDQVLDGAVAGERFVVILLTLFGILALFLATVGVYGVVSYAVSLRTHEIGLRMALGARGPAVLIRVVREGLVLSLVGVAFGVVGSVALSRAFRSMVFGITPTDPVTYAGVVGILVMAVLGASLVPARRASRVSPLVALRDD